MDGQNKLANNDWYVLKTEPRADADVGPKKTADSLCSTFTKIRLELPHTMSLLKRKVPDLFFFSLMRPILDGIRETLCGLPLQCSVANIKRMWAF